MRNLPAIGLDLSRNFPPFPCLGLVGVPRFPSFSPNTFSPCKGEKVLALKYYVICSNIGPFT